MICLGWTVNEFCTGPQKNDEEGKGKRERERERNTDK